MHRPKTHLLFLRHFALPPHGIFLFTQKKSDDVGSISNFIACWTSTFEETIGVGPDDGVSWSKKEMPLELLEIRSPILNVKHDRDTTTNEQFNLIMSFMLVLYSTSMVLSPELGQVSDVRPWPLQTLVQNIIKIIAFQSIFKITI